MRHEQTELLNRKIQPFKGKTKIISTTIPLKTIDPEKIAVAEFDLFAQLPFWSPDSRWLGFFAESKLKKIPVGGGPVQVLADVTDPFGGSWGPDGSIISSRLNSFIFRVSSGGGTVTSVTKLESVQKSQRWPQFLPDGRHFLFHVQLWSSYAARLRR